ncbi:MAG: hypothetical protein GEU93_07440 [Propionibacteriales bacterium]|nr:hypothetical protein [Propionibacteriales bacterium]
MPAEFLGMSIPEAEALESRLDQAQQAINGERTQTVSQAESTGWTGANRDRFMEAMDQLGGSIQGCENALAEARQAVQRQKEAIIQVTGG